MTYFVLVSRGLNIYGFFIFECSRFGYLSQFKICLNFEQIKQNKTFSVIIYTKKKKEEFTRSKLCFESFAVQLPKRSVLRVLTFVSITFRGSQYCIMQHFILSKFVFPMGLLRNYVTSLSLVGKDKLFTLLQ